MPVTSLNLLLKDNSRFPVAVGNSYEISGKADGRASYKITAKLSKITITDDAGHDSVILEMYYPSTSPQQKFNIFVCNVTSIKKV